jgi:hypothetical protein
MITTFNKYFKYSKISILSPYFYWEKPNNLNVEFEYDLNPDLFLFPSKKDKASLSRKIIYILSSLRKFIFIPIYLIIYKIF